jgi:hypothetical protein
LCGVDDSCVIKYVGNYECKCNEGFNGNGNECKAIPKYEGNFIILNKGMEKMRIK